MVLPSDNTLGRRQDVETSTYIVYRNNAAFPYEHEGLFVVTVIVGLVGINEDEVVRPSFSGCYQLICRLLNR